MRQCFECQVELPPFARFCRECGTEQPLSGELSLLSNPVQVEVAEKNTAISSDATRSKVADKETERIAVPGDPMRSEVADKETERIAVLSDPAQSEVADKETAIIAVPGDLSKELARHLAVPTSVPHPELFDEPSVKQLEAPIAGGPARIDQIEERTIPVGEERAISPAKTGELSGAMSSKAAEEWRRSWRDLQRAEAGPALEVSRGHALVPEPLASMEDSLLRIRAVRENNRSPEKDLGFWLMLFLLITLIGVLVLLILWTYFPTGF